MIEPDVLERVVRDAAAAGGIDRRQVFARLRAADGGLWLECSDAEVLRHVLPRLEQTGAEENVQGVLLPRPELRGRAAWVTASVAEVRREARHESEQTTQALQGEVLQPLVHEGGWLLGRLPDGYVGWVRDWHLRLRPEDDVRQFAARCTARVDTNWGALLTAPRADADPCAETVLGTPVVCVQRRSGWAEVELPGGRCGWLPETQLRAGVEAWPADAASILATVRRFLGVPYLWGGRSPKGFDCSGLVQFAFGLHGIALPRDSDQQACRGTAVSRPAAGDLLFFGAQTVTHVAVALDDVEFLHARGEVRRNALGADRPLHDADLSALFRAARRVLPPAT
jgi:hypothetical protein